MWPQSETNTGEFQKLFCLRPGLSAGKATVYARILTAREAAIGDEVLLGGNDRILSEKQQKQQVVACIGDPVVVL